MISPVQQANYVLNDIEKCPESMGYFPSHKNEGRWTFQTRDPLSYRKSIERGALSIFLTGGSSEALKILATKFDVCVFDRYEDLMTDKVLSQSPRSILLKGALFPNPLKPLAATGRSFLHGSIKEAELDDYLDAFMVMGGRRYTEDSRYVAAMWKTIYKDSLCTRDPAAMDKLALFLSKIEARGFHLNPSELSTNYSPQKIVNRILDLRERQLSGKTNFKSSQEELDSARIFHNDVQRYTAENFYSSIYVRALSRGYDLRYAMEDISLSNQFTELFESFFGRYSDKFILPAINIAKTMDVNALIESLARGKSSIDSYKGLVSQNLTLGNLFNLVATLPSSVGAGGRKALATTLAEHPDVKRYLDDPKNLSAFFRDVSINENNDARGVLIEALKPYIDRPIEGAKVKVVDMVYKALLGNLYAWNYFDERSDDKVFIENTYHRLPTEYQSVVLNRVPGFTNALRRLARSSDVRRRHVSEELSI